MITGITSSDRQKLTSPVRDIEVTAEFIKDSVVHDSYTSRDKIVEFTVERIGEENKFFGFGVVHKINIKLIDKGREKKYDSNYSVKIYYRIGTAKINPHPIFHITEVNRDENTNQLSITGYDVIYTNKKTVGDLGLTAPYTVADFITAANQALGCSRAWYTVNCNKTEAIFSTSLADGANFEGHESLREALNDIAEITQSIYYINHLGELTFKRLSRSGTPNLTITKSDYIKLTSGSTHTLSQINKTTELGNNINSTTSGTGNIQYIRDNAFYELLTDSTVGSLLNDAIANVGGLAITQFDCDWRGNFLLEPGDKLQIEAKHGKYLTTFLLDDVIEYKGYLTERTRWDYNPEEGEHSNPSSLGDILNQTVAKVDKVNKEITLVVKETEDMREEVNQIKVSTEGIELSVKELEEEFENFADITIDEDAIVSKVEQKVNASVDAKDNAVKQEMTSLIEQTANGITSTITQKDNELKTELQSQITQTANSITSTVQGQNNKISSIEQTVNGIKLSTNTTNGTASITIGGKTVEVPDGNGIEDMVDDKIEEAVADITITGYVRFEDLERSGKTDINGDNITTGSIAAEYLSLGGWMEVHKKLTDAYSSTGGYIGYSTGDDGVNATTAGCAMSDRSGDNYFIATTSGVRMTHDDLAFMISATTGIKASEEITIGSDARIKNGINYDLEKYEGFYKDLKPSYYKYNHGSSGRDHIGFIAQDVEQAIIDNGLTTQEFAGIVKSVDGDEFCGEYPDQYYLRYDDFIALNTHMIQKLMREVEELKAEIKMLKGEQ